MLDKYIVTLRGESFTLYRDQIEFDAPNYFSALFLGDFSESQTRTVELSRSPELFRIITNYMSGYTIVPLAVTSVPPEMTSDAALENLRRDAEFYGLQGLVALLSNPPPPPRFSAACDVFFLDHQVVDFADVLRGKLPPGVLFDERGVGTMKGQAWLAVPLLAVDTLLVVGHTIRRNKIHNVMSLTSPLINALSVDAFGQRKLPIESKTCTVDLHERQSLVCSLSPFARVSLEGIEATVPQFELSLDAARGILGWKDTPKKHPIDEHMEDVFKLEGYTFVRFAGERIIFTIQSEPSGGWDDTLTTKVEILAARLVSRYNVARDFTWSP
ncbi:hypothetical protein EXIGLDRAFT_843784 [Exidia glandulosa HHB12029]|uniref:BTB domain-containing protein n=1 Tax=Exidia glandulosa HHB12029 TaxID=1314781 RepID=A0A165CGA6_EXIGL|nr:hypothetical protein EXIGLDRAFT_843784 [Exidia glandulosa HHB12029]